MVSSFLDRACHQGVHGIVCNFCKGNRIMKKFLAILTIASSSASGMLGQQENIYSVPAKFYKQDFRNNSLDHHQVVSLKNEQENTEKIFFFNSDMTTSEETGTSNYHSTDCDTNTYGTNDVSNSNNVLGVNGTFGTNQIQGDRPDYDAGSDYSDFCDTAENEIAENEEEIIHVDDTEQFKNYEAVNVEKENVDIQQIESVQQYYNQNYRAGNRKIRQRYLPRGHCKVERKLNETEVRKKLEYLSPFYEKNKNADDSERSDSLIFSMSGISQSGSLRSSVNQYLGDDISTTSK